jgi:hypothetical protein
MTAIAAIAANKECYNHKICARFHKHNLQSTKSETVYPRMEATTPGLSFELCGKKTGVFRRSVDETLFGQTVEDTWHQPSHLVVRACVKKSLLREAEHVYPFKNTACSKVDELVFEFQDANAFCFFIRRLTIELPNTEAAIVGYFADWERLDAKTERRAAITLQKKALERLYSPKVGFYRSQAHHDWRTPESSHD